MGHPRSTCPIATALDRFGDRWTLLLIRDLLAGPCRFRDLAAAAERIPTNILSERLQRLQEYGWIEKVPTAVGSKRLAYQLTEAGRSLQPVLHAIRDWSEPGPPARGERRRPQVRAAKRIGPRAADQGPSVDPSPETFGDHFADLG